jgi:hypothetical protein
VNDEIQRRFKLWDQGYWEVPEGLDTSNFDFNWRPEPYDRPYIHQFGTQWRKTGGPRFVIPENEGIKYQSHQKAIRLADPTSRNWRPLRSNISMDYSWHPCDTDPPYIYVFGNQWYDSETMPTIQYRVKGATEKKYITDIRATLDPCMDRWESPDDITDFDYSWVPHPYDPPGLSYQFGTQWQKTGGPLYKTENSHTIKYVDYPKATKLPNKDNRCWRPLVANATIDFSWHPDDTEPPFIYVFGNQWYDAKKMPTFQYRVKGATEKKYVTDTIGSLLINKTNWTIPEDIEEGFDYSWTPDPFDPPLIYQFGTQWQKTGGPRYTVPGATTIKYIDVQRAIKKPNESRSWRPLVSNIEFDYSWHPDEDEPPYNYIFGNQHYNAEIMPTVMYRVKGATENKYINDVKAKLLPNKDNWVIPDDIENDFDYSWVPNPHDPPLIYQFGTQWQKTGGPKYVVPGATNIKYINTQVAIHKPTERAWRVIEPIESFDFSWHPDDTEEKFNYVFGNEYYSPEHMPTVMYHVKGSANTKYVSSMSAKLQIDKKLVEDSIFDMVKNQTSTTKFVHYYIKDHSVDYTQYIKDSPKLYIHIIDGVEAIVPKEAKTHLYESITDYPYVEYHYVGDRKLEPLDIIFLSNGETIADDNYEHLLRLTKDLPNRVVRISNVNGRVASQHAAANLAQTPWYFLINGKLRVSDDFDFSWQPDRLSKAKHYIFRATNPVNGLVYGHQAIVANNKRLTLNTTVRGLDFTMDSPHAVVDINSGIALYNSSEWDTWRTSFREVIKLCHANDDESKKRLEVWSAVAEGDFAQYSIQGARDAIDYYNEVNGDFEKLKLSYDWAWLKERYTK